MKRRYSSRFDPPAPTLPVRVRARAGNPFERVEALVDTGADLCALPRAVVQHLDFSPVRMARVAGALGQAEVIVYRGDLELDGSLHSRLELLAIDRPYALLGRNALRAVKLVLDGPRGQLDLS